MTGLRRRLASLTCDLIERTMPAGMQNWAQAIRIEVSEIDDATQALFYALACLFSFAWRGVGSLLFRFSSVVADPDQLSQNGPTFMTSLDGWRATPRSVGAICAIGATLLGLVFMIMGGAPVAYLGINLGALVIGLLLFANVTYSCLSSDRWRGFMMLAAGLSLIATALFGLEVEGSARWVKLGPIALQPSLVFVPMLVVAYVRLQSLTATIGMIGAACALALQPDRAMSATLAAGMFALLMSRRDRLTIGVAIASILGCAIALFRPDTGQAVPFVDQIIFESYDVHFLAGMSVSSGLAILMLPALAGLRLEGAIRETSIVFGVVWATVIGAAAFGNYPTPLVGYSGAAVLGYLLSLAMLPKIDATQELQGLGSHRDGANALGSDTSLMLGAA
jgi:hypothetical protein